MRLSYSRTSFRATFWSDRQWVLRYLVMGGGSVSVNLGVFWILYHFLGTWYLLANLIAFLVRSVFKFCVLRMWVSTQNPRRRTLDQFVPFITADVMLYAIGTPLLAALVEWGGLPPPAALIVTIFILYLAGLGIARRLF